MFAATRARWLPSLFLLLVRGSYVLAQPRPSVHPRGQPAEIALPTLSGLLRPQQTALPFDLALHNALSPVPIVSQTPLPSLPPPCAAFLGPTSDSTTECHPSSGAELTAYNITFEDCGAAAAFTLCYCSNAEMSLDTAIDRLARVPIGLRRFVGIVMVMPLGGGNDTMPRAYTELYSGEIHLLGDCQLDTWVHEATHAFDYAPTSAESAPISDNTAWQTAIQSDTCTTDNYALTNRVEDFAQISVTLIYTLLHSNNPPPGLELACMQNQISFLRNRPEYNPETLFGNRCDIPDGAAGVRHNATPAILDATRTFQTVPLDPTAIRKKSDALGLQLGIFFGSQGWLCFLWLVYHFII
ncbi:hypothetical protein C8F01DRAFT_1260570 [Mycena amicta]|nr:hypothetical protein C8F01DRAFT_1260570 [Mycena amicta]